MRKWGWVIESREWGWDGEELEVRKGSYCGLPVISHLEKKKKKQQNCLAVSLEHRRGPKLC